MGAKQEKAENVHEEASSHPEVDANTADDGKGKPLAQGRGKLCAAAGAVVAASRLNQDRGLDAEAEVNAETNEESEAVLTFVGNSTGSFVRTLKLFQWPAAKRLH